MNRRKASYVRLLSVLVTSAVAPTAASSCGGSTGTGSGNDGGSGSSSGGSGGSSGASSSGSGSSSGNQGCASANTSLDPMRCEPQLLTSTPCGQCYWTLEVPCAGDAGAGDAGSGDAGAFDCLALCNAVVPQGAMPLTNASLCRGNFVDGGPALYVSCGGCSAGRPPKGFVARPVCAPSRAAAWLAGMAQLEAASVHAFHALHGDLERLRAPRSLLRSVCAAAKDETRHARVVTRAAARFGAAAPKPRVARVARVARRSLEDLAVANAEEGCVRETFGVALAAMQAASATDRGVKRMMRGIARDELRHAALWRIAAWLQGGLDARGRARVDGARRAAVESLACELGELGAGDARLGLPDARRALESLRRMHAALVKGELGGSIGRVASAATFDTLSLGR
jgi:hypothetical protein